MGVLGNVESGRRFYEVRTKENRESIDKDTLWRVFIFVKIFIRPFFG